MWNDIYCLRIFDILIVFFFLFIYTFFVNYPAIRPDIDLLSGYPAGYLIIDRIPDSRIPDNKKKAG